MIDNAGNILLTELAPNLSYIDDTTAEFPMRYRKQDTTYYRYLGAVFSDASDDLTFGSNDGTNPPNQEGLFVTQFDASNVNIIHGVATGADQTFNTIWTPKWVKVVYGVLDTAPAATESVGVFEVTLPMLDTNWYATQLNVDYGAGNNNRTWVAVTTKGSINAITAQSAGTSGSFTIDAMDADKFFYAIAYTDIL